MININKQLNLKEDVARSARTVMTKWDFLEWFSNTVNSYNWSFSSIKKVIFGIFQLHSIWRWATHSEIWTLGWSENILSLEHLGLCRFWAVESSSSARVKNPRLCNPIKVTGFISPDLTFSAPEDFMTLPMPSFYYLAAIMNVMHNIFFSDDFFQIVSFTEICNTHWKVFRFHEILILLVYSSGCRESISIFRGLHSVWKFPKKSHFSMFAPRAQLKYLNFIRICGYDFDHILARKFKYPKISNTKNITFLARKFKYPIPSIISRTRIVPTFD